MSFNITIQRPVAASVDPQPAAKHFDIIMGLDFHLLLIPPSPAPIPMPVIPFGALVFDPMDYIHITIPSMPCFVNGKFTMQHNVPMGGTVLINGFYRAAATSALMGMPPTVPPIMGKIKALGSVVKKLTPLHFVVPKTNFYIPFFAPHDGQVSNGSKTVWTQGCEQSTLMCPVFSCAHVGRIVLNNPLGFFNNYGTFIIAVLPFGKPVMVGGPKVEHQFKTDDLLNALMFMGIMAAAKFILKMLGKLLTKLNQFLCKKFPKFAPIGRMVQAAICTFLGEPVDVGTGLMASFIKGFSLPGPIPFTWEANYYSFSTYDGPLGKNIYHSYDISLVVEEEHEVVVMNDTAGRAVAFPTLKNGESFYNPAEKFELHRSNEGEYYVVTKAGLYYYFNQAPDNNGYYNIRSISNRNGYAIRFSYNNRHLLEQIIDSAGRVIKVQNNDRGLITSLIMQHPDNDKNFFSQVRYEYDDDGRMLAVFDAEGYANHFEWNRRLVTARTFADGIKFIFEYDKDLRCTASLGPDGLYSYRFEYFGNHTEVTNSLGYKSTYFHNNGIVTRIVNPMGGQRFFNYDEFNNLVAETDENGIVKTYEYDERGNVTRIGLPAKGDIITVYNGQNKPIKKILPNGAIWQYEYDEANNLSERINPYGNSDEYGYTDGLLTSVSDDRDGIFQLSYDRQYNVSEIRLKQGTIKFKYDTMGRCVGIKYPNASQRVMKYNLRGELTSLFERDGTTKFFRYSAKGDIVDIQGPSFKIKFRYNFFGRVTERTEGSAQTRYYYDTEGNLVAVQNAANNLFRFELDPNGRIKKEIGFDDRQKEYFRDAGGRIVRMIRNDQSQINYEYNAASQPIKVLHEDDTELFEYDSLGKLSLAINKTATIEIQRNLLGQAIQEKCNNNSITVQYDARGNKIYIHSDLGAKIKFGYDRLTGDIENIDAGEWQANLHYKKNGYLENFQLPGDVVQTFEYDNAGRLIEQSVFQNQSCVHERSYLWDAGYTLDQITDSTFGIKKITYDSFNNPVTIKDSQKTEHRPLDFTGNVFETLEMKDRIYGKAGELLESRDAIFSYDSLGNLIQKKDRSGKEWNYGWSSLGLLTTVTAPDGAITMFTYDALGRRLQKTSGGVVTKWEWHGNAPLHEWKESLVNDQQGPSEKENIITWIFNNNYPIPLGKVDEKGASSVICDLNGTPFSMFDDKGNRTWTANLDKFGKVQNKELTIDYCPFRFQGQYEDQETGLYYNRFRYYSPQEGVYFSQDPISIEGDLNVYKYVSDPNVFVDPLGLISNSAELGNNLGPKPGTNYDAHHIVMSGSQDPRMASLRGQMASFEPPIKINSADNGIWLPRTGADRVAGDISSAHKGEGLHGDAYKQEMFDRLNGKNREDFLKELDKINEELEGGKTFACKK